MYINEFSVDDEFDRNLPATPDALSDSVVVGVKIVVFVFEKISVSLYGGGAIWSI